jgi:3D (Asp-Asp-Asp) domain-containing protein
MFVRGWIVFSFLFLAACAQDSGSDDSRIVPTIYYKPTFSNTNHCASRDVKELLTTQGKTIGRLCEKDFDQCALQGSCFIQDENGNKISYNVHSRQDGILRFVQTDSERCPYGLGASNICLDPYFSVAADLTYYELGDVIYVPRLAGITLPDGQVHDGFLVIRDKGGAIKGINRFDFFTGELSPKNENNVFAQLGFADKSNRFDFRRASDIETRRVRQQRGYPNLK